MQMSADRVAKILAMTDPVEEPIVVQSAEQTPEEPEKSPSDTFVPPIDVFEYRRRLAKLGRRSCFPCVVDGIEFETREDLEDYRRKLREYGHRWRKSPAQPKADENGSVVNILRDILAEMKQPRKVERPVERPVSVFDTLGIRINPQLTKRY